MNSRSYVIIFCMIIISSILFSQVSLNDESMLRAVSWHQTAAEYDALCYQAYNIASGIIKEASESDRKKQPAIIVDVDETVVNNSYYNAREIFEHQPYPESFYNYIAEATGTAISGAYDFLALADSLGYKIFYITNRREKGRVGTEENLRKLNFPQVSTESVLMKTDVSSKQPRRDFVAKNYDIILLMGDNLIDFSDIFEQDSIATRKDAVDEMKAEFGSRFIILPNVMHGAWAKAVYDFEKGLTAEEKQNKMIEKIKTTGDAVD